MRKKALPIGILVMVLVVLLAAVGISYGYWAEDITAKASVSTGELDVRWASSGSGTTASGSPGAGACSVAVDSSNNNKLNVTLSQIQPGFKCDFTASIKNEGTVPVIITINPSSDITQTGGYTFNPADFQMSIGTCSTGSPLEIAPGAIGTCSGSFKLVYGASIDNATENRNAYYTVTAHATQKP